MLLQFVGVALVCFKRVGYAERIGHSVNGQAAEEWKCFLVVGDDLVFGAVDTDNGGVALAEPGGVEDAAPEIYDGGYAVFASPTRSSGMVIRPGIVAERFFPHHLLSVFFIADGGHSLELGIRAIDGLDGEHAAGAIAGENDPGGINFILCCVGFEVCHCGADVF